MLREGGSHNDFWIEEGKFLLVDYSSTIEGANEGQRIVKDDSPMIKHLVGVAKVFVLVFQEERLEKKIESNFMVDCL